MSGFLQASLPIRQDRRAARALWRALCGAVVCAVVLGGPVQAQSRSTILAVPIRFEGVDGGPTGTPRWRVEVSADEIQAQLGVLREGDTIRLRIVPTGPRQIGLWLQDDRYFAREECRTRWFRRTCNRIYETRTCLLEYIEDPVNGALSLSVQLQPYAEGAGNPNRPPRQEPIATLGNGTSAIRHAVTGSRRLVLSGAFASNNRLLCRSLRGEARGNPVLRDVLGYTRPETFFQLRIDVVAPVLED